MKASAATGDRRPATADRRPAGVMHIFRSGGDFLALMQFG
jgi:hypothetical protein